VDELGGIPAAGSESNDPAPSCSRKVDVVLEASFAGAFQQTKQRRSLCRAGPAPDDDDDAVMRLAFRQVDEVVAVAGHQKTTVFLCKLEDNEIFGFLLEHIAEARDFVAEFLE